MIQLIELIHLMDSLHAMILDGVCDPFYLTSHLCYCCYSLLIQFWLMKNLMMIQLVELIRLVDSLCRMIRDDAYNSLHPTKICLVL